MTRLIYAVPILIFSAILIFLWIGLTKPETPILPSALIDKPAPMLTLPPLDRNAQGFGPRDLRSGHVTVVNFFASWCAPCHLEGAQLAAIARVPGVALYGLVYKDTPAKTRAFLAEVGNPFARIGLDASGRVGIEWGITGVPETFVIDGKGIVRDRFAGPLTDETLSREILPAIAQARS